MIDSQEMLTPEQVGNLYGVDPKTVGKWAKEGLVISVVTPNGHRRYPSAQFGAVYQARRASMAVKESS